MFVILVFSTPCFRCESGTYEFSGGYVMSGSESRLVKELEIVLDADERERGVVRRTRVNSAHIWQFTLM